MKKQNWKGLRVERPCRECGANHETKQCLTRKGQLRNPRVDRFRTRK